MTNPIIEAIAREQERDNKELPYGAAGCRSVIAAAERLGFRLVDIEKITQSVLDACNDTQTLGDVMKAVVDHTQPLTDESA